MQTLHLSAVLSPEDGGYAALCPELDIASQGESIDEAVANLKEAVEGFLDVASQNEIDSRLKKPSLFTHFEVTRA
jgi:predicted RNase H-like HicB family nuclease